MILSDLHTHTTFCDGKNTPAEMAEEAAARGMELLGFSGHGYTAFDESYCMSREGQEAYRKEIARLKEAYRGRLRILCGVEKDLFSEEDVSGFDYCIGSAHYLRIGDVYRPVDESPEITEETVREYFGGDPYAYCEAYYEAEGSIGELLRPDIAGHFDLVSKFNEKHPLFDEEDARYVRAWQKAADRLLASGCRLFEINTGAMSRGWKSVPYPREEMRAYIRARGGKFLLSSDSHSKETLLYGFDRLSAEADTDPAGLPGYA